jgi:hypothetical protein
MRISRRALLLSASAAALGAPLPLRRSFADSEIKEYRLTARPGATKLAGSGYPDIAGATLPFNGRRSIESDHANPVRAYGHHPYGSSHLAH